MLWKWNVQNTEPTVPSTEKNKFLLIDYVLNKADIYKGQKVE